MIDALQVFVRGFEDGERGEAIVGYLKEIGFTVEDIFDGRSDSLGGLIKTDVVYQDHLEETDPDIIVVELRRRTEFDGLWLQTRKFQLADEGEYGRDGEDEEDDSDVLSFPSASGE